MNVVYSALRLAVGSLVRNHKVVLVLVGYFDDSGKLTTPGEKVVAVAGCVSSVEMWEAFEHEWKGLLEDFGISLFHMKTYNHSRDEFLGWDKTKKESFMGKALDIIDKNTLAFTGAAVLINAWNQLSEEERYVFQDPYYICFQTCVRNAAIQTLDHADDEKVQIIFEEQPGQMGLAADLYDRCAQELDLKERLGGFAFRKKTEAIQLQTADLIAYEIRRFVMSGRPFQGEFHIEDNVKPKGMRWTMWQILLRKPERSFFNFYDLKALRTFLG